MTRTLTAAQARRIALHAQGFNDPRPAGRVDARHLRRVLRRIGLIQIDSVNVLVRSHYMPLFSRLGPYPMRLLDDAAYQRRDLFEAWAHAACFVPVEHYRLLRPRMDKRGPPPRIRAVVEDRGGYVDSTLAEVRERGPRPIPAPAARRGRPGACGRVAVFPGGIILGDGDGVAVTPKALAAEVAKDGLEQERYERFAKLKIKEGRPVPGIYPPNEEAKAEYQAWLKAGEPEG